MAEWVIAGKPKDAVPEVGKVYEIKHSRKGTFTGRIVAVLEDFATVEVISGKPHFASREAKLFDPEPEFVSIRDSLCYLIERGE